MRNPASFFGCLWREAMPVGNGRIGGLVYGAVAKETILLTHEDAWWLGKSPELPDVSNCLEEVRQLLDKNRVEEAEKHLYKRFP